MFRDGEEETTIREVAGTGTPAAPVRDTGGDFVALVAVAGGSRFHARYDAVVNVSEKDATNINTCHKCIFVDLKRNIRTYIYIQCIKYNFTQPIRASPYLQNKRKGKNRNGNTVYESIFAKNDCTLFIRE